MTYANSDRSTSPSREIVIEDPDQPGVVAILLLPDDADLVAALIKGERTVADLKKATTKRWCARFKAIVAERRRSG